MKKITNILLCCSLLLGVNVACTDEFSFWDYHARSWMLTPEITTPEPEIAGETVAISIRNLDNLYSYFSHNWDGKEEVYFDSVEASYGICLALSSDMSDGEELNVLNRKKSASNTFSLSTTSYDYSYTIGDGDVLINISSLKARTTYYYYAYARRGGSTVKGEVKSFTTEELSGIHSLEELIAFRNAYNTGRDVSAYMTGNTIYLLADIDMKDIDNWEPLSELSEGYVFDGYGHTIKNMKISLNSDYAGFICKNYGTVRNLNIGEGSSVEGKQYCGGICGKNYITPIMGCSNAATVTGSDYVGGITGYSSYGNLTNNTNSGSVRGTNNVGGITGYSRYGSLTNNTNSGSVRGKYYTGGIVGYAYNSSGSGYAMKVEKNTNMGAIIGTINTGGIAGYRSSYYVSVSNNTYGGTVNGERGSERNAIGND